MYHFSLWAIMFPDVYRRRQGSPLRLIHFGVHYLHQGYLGSILKVLAVGGSPQLDLTWSLCSGQKEENHYVLFLLLHFCLSFFFSCRGLYEYELTLRPDMYTAKHTQWFYFRVRNMKAGAYYRFTIVNLMKSSSLYFVGMKPLLYSERAAKETSVGWRRTGSNIRYFRSCNQVDEPAVARQPHVDC